MWRTFISILILGRMVVGETEERGTAYSGSGLGRLGVPTQEFAMAVTLRILYGTCFGVGLAFLLELAEQARVVFTRVRVRLK